MKVLFGLGAVALLTLPFPPPQDGSHLLTRDPGQVISEYGVPVRVESELSHLTFEFRGRHGRDWAVVFHDDAVVRVVGEPEPPRARQRAPLTGPYLGQAVRELLQRMHMPESHEAQGADLVLRFPRGPQVTLRHGRVVAIER